MSKSLLASLVLLLMLASTALCQQVIISDFPIGVGGSIKLDHLKPYETQLRQIADTLRAHPLARVVVTGGADGEKYRRNQDAVNPGLAVGRAHVLRELLVHELNVDSTQVIVQSEDTKLTGPEHRFASVRVDWTLSDIDRRLKALEDRPPVERIVTQVQPAPMERVEVHSALEYLGLQFGAGGTTSPFGGMPMISGAVTWKRALFVEAIFGHTFWNGSFLFQNSSLATKRRMIGAQAIVYPYSKIPVGVVGGWVRIEEISQHYYKYVKLSEGPLLGLRFAPTDFLAITGTYNPAKHRFAGADAAREHNDQFMLNLTANVAIGGGR